jgi:NADH:ubiquinone oxidoreductase subunit 2 (subunit N)
LTVYNLSSIFILWTLHVLGYSSNLTIFAWSSLKTWPSVCAVFTVTLFSMAGVPPFIGFFTKLFILLSFINKSFFFLFFYFTPITLISLYFYVQNARHVYTSSWQKIYNPVSSLGMLAHNVYYVYFSTIHLLFLILAPFYLFDLLLYFKWLF